MPFRPLAPVRSPRWTPLSIALSLTLAAGLAHAPAADATASLLAAARPLHAAAAPAVVPPDDLRRQSTPAQTSLLPADADGRFPYIVVLREAPLATYEGGLTGLPPIPRIASGARSGRIDVDSPEARAYVGRVQSEQARFTAALGSRFGRQVAATRTYQHAINALALNLTEAEAEALREDSAVALVARERRRELRTFGSPGFIGADALWTDPSAPNGQGYRGEGMVIGVIDSGINYLSKSVKAVSDDGYVHVNPLGANFLGLCRPGQPNAGHCNAKLIGMYASDGTNNGRDLDGHGSHTATTAGGGFVNNAGYDGGSFVLSGVAPRANLIAYNGCGVGAQGCADSALLASINQAVADGIVDVINYSIGGPNDGPWLDAIDQAFLGATSAGIFIATAAGNDGPGEATTDSYAPWYSTVGATSSDGLPGFVLTANGWSGSATMVRGSDPGPTSAFANRPLIESPGFANGTTDGCSAYPANTFRHPQNAGGTQGIAVLRLDQNNSGCFSSTRRTNALNAGATAVVFVDPDYIFLGATGSSYSLLLSDWNALKSAVGNVGGGAGATGSISYPIGVGSRQGDVLAGFSSRGPVRFNTLKPDVSAPGDSILAAVSPIASTGYTQAGQQATTANLYSVYSGTSMATPHVAGAAALVRQVRPDWTPVEVKSALMSTAHRPVVHPDNAPANPNQRGSGRIRPDLAARAGLVLDESVANFQAANPGTGGDASQLNLASYYHFDCAGVCSFPRTVKSTGTAATWNLSVSGLPAGSFSLSHPGFALGASGSQSFTLSVDSTLLPANQWQYGELTLTPSTPTLPTQHFTIALRAATPRLTIDTSAITETLAAGQSTQRTLQIGNAGNPTLLWSIPTSTLRGSLLKRPVSPDFNGLSDRTVVTGTTTGDIVSSNVNNAYGADWFEILAGGTRVVELGMGGFGCSGATGDCTDFPSADQFATQIAFRIYADAGGQPAGRPGVAGDAPPLFQWPAAAGGGPPSATGLSYPGFYEVRLNLEQAGVTLPTLGAGRYWLNFAPSINGTGTRFFQFLSQQPGKSPSAFYVTPNASGNPSGRLWQPTTTAGGAAYTGYQMDVVVDATCSAPWLSYSSTGGSLGLAGSTSVQVTLDATGLAPGQYSAYLCISGNGTSPPTFAGGQDSFLLPVRLTVTSAPNQPPAFVGAPYSFSVPARSAATTAVGSVFATDADGHTVSYSITGGNTGSAFAINASSGAITVASPAAVTLANSPFSLAVSASDGNGGSTGTVVTINATNQAPTFTGEPYAFTVETRSPPATSVGTLAASDPNGDSLAFAITGGNTGGAFAVNPTSGVITVASAAPLLLSNSPFALQVTVSDGLGGVDASTVAISISNAPPVVSDQAFGVRAGSADGSPVGSIVFSDPNAGDQASITVTGGSGQTVFSVSVAGLITVANSAALVGGASFTLLVTATDLNGATDTATITIEVRDDTIFVDGFEG